MNINSESSVTAYFVFVYSFAACFAWVSLIPVNYLEFVSIHFPVCNSLDIDNPVFLLCNRLFSGSQVFSSEAIRSIFVVHADAVYFFNCYKLHARLLST